MGTRAIRQDMLSTTALAAGTYNEFVMLTDPNAVDSPQEIALNVTTAAVPEARPLRRSCRLATGSF